MTGDTTRRRPKAVGLIERRGSYWILACDPHVNVLLKRVFLRVDKASDTEIRIRSTPEVDRDIEWLRDRFVLDMSDKDEALLHRGAEVMRERERISLQVEDGVYIPRTFVGMAKEPREYQRIAADLCLRNEAILVGDSMGLGKTITALTMLAEPRTLPAVVFTISAGMAEQWAAKVAEFLPHLRTHILAGATPYDIPERCDHLAERSRRNAARDGQPLPDAWSKGAYPDIIILPYSRMVGWMDVLKTRATTIIWDEVQELRHPDTLKFRAATAIRSRATFCMGLSGTPIHGYGGQYFNVLEVIRPGALGEREEFHREWCVSADEERKIRVKDPRAFGLHLRTAGLMIQRTRKDVGRELPAVTTTTVPVDSDLSVLAKVKSKAYELARVILGHSASTNFARMQAGGEMDRLMRQATGIAKAPAVATLVRMLVEQEGPVLVGAWHREVYSILADELKDLAPVFYSGTETEKQKREALAAFLSGKTKVLILSLRAGAGIDGLQHVASQCVIAELDWAPQIHDQFIARLARDGQTKPVFAYIPLGGGSDDVVSDVCGAKRANSEPIINVDEARADAVQTDPAHIRKLAQAYIDAHK